MSHEWQGPNATWRGPDDQGWNDARQEEEEPSPQLQELDDADATNTQGEYSDDEFEEEAEATPSAKRFEAMRQLGQQFSPIFVPLLFAGLTFLLTAPLLLTNKLYLHSERLWPFALVLLAVAIMQGTALYYSGSNNNFWWLSIIGGFLLFLLVACFTIFGPISTAIFLVVLIIACFIGVRLYVRPVPEGTVDIIYAFGKYSRTLFPGFNFLLPWEVVDIHLQTREKQWTCPEQVVQVSPDNDVHLKAVISYQLMPEDAHLAVTQIDKWEESLHNLFITCLQQASNDLKPDDFIAWPQRQQQGVGLRLNEADDDENSRWAKVNDLLFQRIRDLVANWGVFINWVYIRDITLTPHSSATYNPDRMLAYHAEAADEAPPQFQGAAGRVAPAGPPREEVPAAAASARLKATNAAPPPAPPATTPPLVASAGPAAARMPKEDALIKAYKQIQSEKIKSPATIREIAGRFLAIANDPDASKNASFDASRAAQALYDRADLYEKQAASMGEVIEDDTPTQVDWSYPNHTDEDNYMGG
jgi:regulator of protease activity HflC (stomatin/prohibitin superfamily)